MYLGYFVGEQSEPCVIQSVSVDNLNITAKFQNLLKYILCPTAKPFWNLEISLWQKSALSARILANFCRNNKT